MSGGSDSLPELVAADGHRFAVALARTTIGRDADAEIRLSDRTVSGHHATLDAMATGVVLTDLRSKNGTFVNDQRLEDGAAVQLRNGDVVRLGVFELHFMSASRAIRAGGMTTETFVGRAAQLLQLGTWATESSGTGMGRFVLVPGEAGVGKTRLCAEFARQCAVGDVNVAWSRCWGRRRRPATLAVAGTSR